jgi:hypothetical protein
MPRYKAECDGCMYEHEGHWFEINKINFSDCPMCGLEECPKCSDDHKECREEMKQREEDEDAM